MARTRSMMRAARGGRSKAATVARPQSRRTTTLTDAVLSAGVGSGPAIATVAVSLSTVPARARTATMTATLERAFGARCADVVQVTTWDLAAHFHPIPSAPRNAVPAGSWSVTVSTPDVATVPVSCTVTR